MALVRSVAVESFRRFPVQGAAALALRPARSGRSFAAAKRGPLHRLGSAEVVDPTALVVDPDASSRSVLAMALQREGFVVLAAETAEAALRMTANLPVGPELVVSEVTLPGIDGFSLCESLRARADNAPRCVILLTRGEDPSYPSLARTAGADELLPKPAFVSDVLALAKLNLDAEIDGPVHTTHTADLPLPQLVRALLTARRNGRIRMHKGTGTLGFRNGAIVECSFEGMNGERAVERMLALANGSFEVSFGLTLATDDTRVELEELCARILPQLRRWTRVLATSAPLDSVLAVDVRAFSRAVASLPHDIDKLARLCDGKRAVRQVLVEAPFNEVVALEALTRLYALGVVVPLEDESGPSKPSGWAANDERIIPAATHAEFRRGLAPELVKQLDAFNIRTLVEPAGPAFEFVADDAQISEVDHPTAAPYEWPAELAPVTASSPSLTAAIASHVEVVARGAAEAEGVARADAQPVKLEAAAHNALTDAFTLAVGSGTSEALSDPAIRGAALPKGRAVIATGAAILLIGASVALIAPAPSRAPLNPRLSAAVATEAAWYPQAVRLYESGDVDGARQLLETGVAEAPGAADAWLYLALARFDSGEASAAEVAAMRAVELDPASVRAELLLGKLAEARGDSQAAAQHRVRAEEIR